MLVLIVFIPPIILVGYLIYRFKNARLTRAWQPLHGLFEEARIQGDGGGDRPRRTEPGKPARRSRAIYLLDTNVVSRLCRPKLHGAVVAGGSRCAQLAHRPTDHHPNTR